MPPSARARRTGGHCCLLRRRHLPPPPSCHGRPRISSPAPSQTPGPAPPSGAPTPAVLQEVPTLRQLWARGQQVVLSYDDECAVRRHRQLWPAIPYWWGNQVKPEKLVRYLEQMQREGRPGGCAAAGGPRTPAPHARPGRAVRAWCGMCMRAQACACVSAHANTGMELCAHVRTACTRPPTRTSRAWPGAHGLTEPCRRTQGRSAPLPCASWSALPTLPGPPVSCWVLLRLACLLLGPPPPRCCSLLFWQTQAKSPGWWR